MGHTFSAVELDPTLRAVQRPTHLVIDGAADEQGNSTMKWVLTCGHTTEIALLEGVNLIPVDQELVCATCAKLAI